VRAPTLPEQSRHHPLPPDATVLAAVDAIVAATALGASPAVILTGDPDDLSRLVGDDSSVHVRPLP
jgi:hypothetical protein